MKKYFKRPPVGHFKFYIFLICHGLFLCESLHKNKGLKGHFEIVRSHKLIRSMADIAVHICQIKRSDGNFLASIFLLVALVIKGLII